MTPQETDPYMPMSVQESPTEALVWWWPASGLEALSVAVPAWDLMKEVTIIFITSTIVSVQFSSFQSLSRVRLFATP